MMADDLKGGLQSLTNAGGGDALMGALSGLAANPIDPTRKWGAFAAGVLAPKRGADFGEALSGGLSAMNDAEGKQEALKASYVPHVTQALLEAAKLQRQRQIDDLTQKLFFGEQVQQAAHPPMPGQLGSGMFGAMSPPNGIPSIPNPSQVGQPNFGSRIGNMSLDQIEGLKQLTGRDSLPAWKIAREGIEKKVGTYYQPVDGGAPQYIADPTKGFSVDANGNSILMPNFAENNAAIEGVKTDAQERAKARYDLVKPNDFDLKGGKTIPFGATRLDLVSNSKNVQNQNQPSNEDGGLDISQLTPQQIQFLAKKDPVAFQNGIAKFYQNQGKVNQQPNVTSNDSGMEYESAEEKLKSQENIKGMQGTKNEVNKNWIENKYNPVLKNGEAAKKSIDNIDLFNNMNLKTGWGADSKALAGNILTTLGIAPESLKDFTSDAQKFTAVAKSRLADVMNRDSVQGTQTENDAKRFEETFARLSNTQEANRFIADMLKAKAENDLRKSKFYEFAMPHARDDGDLTIVDREWAKKERSLWDSPIMQKWKNKK